MKIVETTGLTALCESSNGTREEISLALVGEQPVGTHVIVFIDSAIRVLTQQEHGAPSEARQAAETAGKAQDFDHLLDHVMPKNRDLRRKMQPANDIAPFLSQPANDDEIDANDFWEGGDTPQADAAGEPDNEGNATGIPAE